MSAAVGGAIVPVLQGALADRIGVQHAFLASAICYVYVAFYGFRGWKPAAGNLRHPVEYPVTEHSTIAKPSSRRCPI